jgi:hypothetical protein
LARLKEQMNKDPEQGIRIKIKRKEICWMTRIWQFSQVLGDTKKRGKNYGKKKETGNFSSTNLYKMETISEKHFL